MPFSAMLFKELRKATGLTQAEFGDKIGVGGGTVSLYEKGKVVPPSDKLPLIARAFGITIDQLLNAATDGGNVQDEPGRYVTGNVGKIMPRTGEMFTYLSYISAKAQMGNPKLTFENCHVTTDETYPVFVPNFAFSKKHLVIEVVGDSMLPEIRSGAHVLAEQVRKDDIKYESGGVYAVMYGNGRFVVKRIKTNDINRNGTLTLWSDNEQHGSITIRAEDIQCMWKVLIKVNEVVQ